MPFETQVPILALQFGPSVTVPSLTMASADFCLCFPFCCQFGTRYAGRGQTSPGSHLVFPPTPPNRPPPSAQVWGFTVLDRLTRGDSLVSGSYPSVWEFLHTFLPTPPHDDAVGFKLRFPLQGPQRTCTASQHSMPGTPKD